MAYLDSFAQVVLSPIPRVQVTVYDSVTDWGGGLGFPPATPGVVRVNADGTREQVRSTPATDDAGRSVWIDYECPQQEQVTYQAMPTEPGAVVTSSNPVVMPDVGPWLVDPSNPAGSVPLMMTRDGFGGWTRTATVSVTPIAGSAIPYVVESSVRQAPTGDLTVSALDTAAHDALVAILATPGPKLFSWPRSYYPAYGQVRWAFVSTLTDTSFGVANVKWHTQLSLQPSARPAVVAQQKGLTWGEARAQGLTWAMAREQGLTWGAV